MIEFNKPPYVGSSMKYMREAVRNKHISGDGYYTKRCSQWVEQKMQTEKCLFTTSCTHALEMTAILIDMKEGDEVIMPSYTFASTADAFALRGAKIIFVDIRPDTMNIDETKIEQAITMKTKAIVCVHYAGVSCEMDEILKIAEKYHLFVIEDAAQGILSSYKGKALGTIGNFGCYSFHETKNFSMGEGGAILIRDKDDIERAEILREKGTNRSKFWRGEIDKYSWVDIGSSYLPSELNMAYLWSQLEIAEKMNELRLNLWNLYHEELKELEENGCIIRPFVPKHCKHNAHLYYIKVKDIEERDKLIAYLKKNHIQAVFHYIPLHNAPAGKKYGEFFGEDCYTTKESERLLRLPLYYGLTYEEAKEVVNQIYYFYKNIDR